ncbi:MAG: ATP-binding protein, partial [Clostridia bacterium]|nr:ATP-binding protein [Clostridia bacterium]
TTFNLSEQIRTCFVILESKWSNRDLDFSLDFDEYDVTANEEMLKQVWLNLIDNALKFTPEGGRIAVTIVRDWRLTVSVFNSGSFIAEENRERVFRKFYQEDPSHSTRGNGVGLSLVRAIVELHGGKVTCSSDGEGTTFTVRLPLRK